MEIEPQSPPPAPASAPSKVLVRHPVIVLLICAYNEERFLQRTIDSVKNQTWTDFAVLISDNASTDRTGEIGRAAAADDPRFHYYRQPVNVGAFGNGVFTRHASESPFVMWLGAHDVIAPTFLGQHLSALMSEPRVSLSYAHTCWIDDHGNPLHVTTSPGMEKLPDIPIVRYVLTPRLIDWCTEFNNVIRRDALEGIDFRPHFGGDMLILAHLAYRGPFHCVPEPLYLRWKGDTSDLEDYMERIMGRPGFAADYNDLIEAFDRHLRTLATSHPLRPLASIIVRAILQHRYRSERPGPLAKVFGLIATTKRQLRARKFNVAG